MKKMLFKDCKRALTAVRYHFIRAQMNKQILKYISIVFEVNKNRRIWTKNMIMSQP